MRVLDPLETLLVSNEVLVVSEMGGKKNKKQPSTPSGSNSRKASTNLPAVNGEKAEGSENSPSIQCRHLKSSVNLAQVRKKLKDCRNFRCEECQKASKTDGAQESGVQEENDVFCCLACGHLGCGRNSTEKHALTHFKAPRSGPHTIVLNVRTFELWCYECDNDVPPGASTSLKDLVDLVGRQVKAASGLASQPSANGEKKPSAVEDSKATPVKTRAGARNSVIPAEIKGLSNLGNTCFFNAVMQNMAQTHVLQILLNETQAFQKGSVFSIHPQKEHDNESGTALPTLQVTIEREPEGLTSAFRHFLSEFRQNGKSSILNPGTLFGQVCKKATRFRGFQQQDSHELLRYMLDALKSEETRRLRAAVVRHFGLDPDNIKADAIDTNFKNKVKAYDVSNLTFVEQVFGGQLLQVIECLQCHHPSKRNEPFLDLSLPIVDPKDAKKLAAHKKDDEDLKVLVRGDKKDFTPSKHQQKKAKAKSRKLAKAAKRRGSTAEDAQENGQPAEENNNESASAKEGNEVTQLADDLAQTLVVNGVDKSPKSDVVPPENMPDSGNSTFTISEKGDATDSMVTAVECNGDSGLKSSDSEDDEEHEDEKPVKEDEQQMSIAGGEENVSHSSDSVVEPLNTEESAASHSDCTLAHCLRQFTAVELLNGKNKFGCSNCAKSNHAGRHGSGEGVSVVANGNATADENKKHRKDSNPVVYTDAQKRYLIYSPPAVLTLHLKRFHQVGSSMRKISKHVDFPLILDISPYCCKNGNRYKSTQKRVLYSLYGIVCHSGGLSGGHYIAYVKVRARDDKLAAAFLASSVIPSANESTIDVRNGIVTENGSENQLENGIAENGRGEPAPAPGKWYHVSDTHVSEVQESRVLAAEAYLLFYERIF